MSANLILAVLWIVTGTVSSAWSTSINSLFTLKHIKGSATGNEMGLSSDLLESIAHGAQMAIENCQHNFKWDRWNCPESAFTRRGRQLSTRETAFVLAVTSAGVVHAVTSNCSRGELPDCGCDSHHSFGCSDNVDYGEQVAKNILDNLERGMDMQAYVNLHNNAAGRMAVRTTMVKRCRCHGDIISDICAKQTCWMEMAPFNEVVDELRRKYEQALRVDQEPIFNSVTSLTSDSVPNVPTPTDHLLYLMDSPNYCEQNVTYGWNGTVGRECSRNKSASASVSERNSCRRLCRSCGRRVRRQRRQRTWRCNCTFKWCCQVTCDTCTEKRHEFYCE